MRSVTAREVVMMSFRCFGVLAGLEVTGKALMLISIYGDKGFVWGLLEIAFLAIATVALFLFPDRLAAACAQRVDTRLSGYALSVVGVLCIVTFGGELLQNVATISTFGPGSENVKRILGIHNDPISLAIQVVAILIGVALVIFAKNFAEWTDMDWWRQRAFEDAQR